ncbi:MAG: V-type ATP synthase subunit D [Methanosarcinales archaeon]|uniref:A-type ATP synthase subunit D n=1 Tax=Candidatus Ethanoperedens thermophilum TaxID=2766897 RepID=A0A848DBX0_9EURY|nr:V-type ATP synthase subunit D [Candidatus Ethanoperedens thermophilum]
MAIKDTIKPTRSELIGLKKKIKLSESGHKLLKMKRDGLIIELFDILNKAKNVRSEVEKDYEIAQQNLNIAKAIEGVVAVKSTAFALKDTPVITLESKNVMGVVVPRIKSTSVKKNIIERGYGIIGTSSRIDEAADAYENLVEKIIIAAEIETTMKKLLDDIEKTKRRVNALEFKVIPELSEARNFIMLRLEEMEREETFRLKRIKS